MSLDDIKQPTNTSMEPATQDTPQDPFAAFEQPVRPEDKPGKKRRLNPRLRTLFIAVGAVVALVAVLLLIPLLPEQNAGSSAGSTSGDTLTYTLLDKTTNKKDTVAVSKAAITNESGSFTISYDNKEDVYKLVGYEDLDLEADTATTLTDCGALITAMDKMQTVGKLNDYGLDKPKASATFTYHDNTSATLHVGNLTPTEDGYYVRLQDSDEVYVCSQSAVESFLLTAGQLVETTLIAAPTVKTDDKDGIAVLKDVAITGAAHSQPLTVRRTSSNDKGEFLYFSHLIVKPYLRGVNETVSQELSSFNSLVASEAVVLHPTKQQLKEFGFDKPHTTADITLAVETSPKDTKTSDAPTNAGESNITMIYYGLTKHTIRVGAVTKDNHYLVMVDDIDAIFLVANTTLACIVERDYENTVSQLLFLKDIKALSRITVVSGGKEYPFTLTHHPEKENSDEKLTVTLNGKTTDTAQFRTLYQLMMGLERYDTVDTLPASDADLSITMYNADGSVYLSTTFFPYTGSQCVVKTTEGELFTTKTSFITHFTQQLENYLNGKTVLVR